MSFKNGLAFTSTKMRRSGESGQALIETAITVSMLMILLIGAAEIGRIAWAAIQVTTASKAAVQYGDQGRQYAADTKGIQIAGAAAAPGLPNLNVTPVVSCVCGNSSAAVSCTNSVCPSNGSFIEVLLTVNTSTTFDPLIHLPGLPKTFTIQHQAIQKILSNQ